MDSTSPNPRSYTLAETAGILRCSERTLHRLIKDGAVRTVLISTRRRIVPATEIERILNSGISAEAAA
jgi:predicted site-specific integrase-resolvase